MNARFDSLAALRLGTMQLRKSVGLVRLWPLVLLLLPAGCCATFVFMSLQRAHLQNVHYEDLDGNSLFSSHLPPAATNIDVQGMVHRGSGLARFKLREGLFRTWAEDSCNAVSVDVTPSGKTVEYAYVDPQHIGDELLIKNGWYCERTMPSGACQWFAYDADSNWCYASWWTN